MTVRSRVRGWWTRDVGGLPRWLLIVSLLVIAAGLCFVLVSPDSSFQL